MGQVISVSGAKQELRGPIILQDAELLDLVKIVISHDNKPAIQIENFNGILTINSLQDQLCRYVQNPNLVDFEYPFLLQLDPGSEIEFTVNAGARLSENDSGVDQDQDQESVVDSLGDRYNDAREYRDGNVGSEDIIRGEANADNADNADAAADSSKINGSHVDTSADISADTETTESNLRLIFHDLCIVRGKTRTEIYEKIEILKRNDASSTISGNNHDASNDSYVIGDVYADDSDDYSAKFRFSFNYKVPDSGGSYVYSVFHFDNGDYQRLMEFSVWVDEKQDHQRPQTGSSHTQSFTKSMNQSFIKSISSVDQSMDSLDNSLNNSLDNSLEIDKSRYRSKIPSLSSRVPSASSLSQLFSRKKSVLPMTKRNIELMNRSSSKLSQRDSLVPTEEDDKENEPVMDAENQPKKEPETPSKADFLSRQRSTKKLIIVGGDNPSEPLNSPTETFHTDSMTVCYKEPTYEPVSPFGEKFPTENVIIDSVVTSEVTTRRKSKRNSLFGALSIRKDDDLADTTARPSNDIKRSRSLRSIKSNRSTKSATKTAFRKLKKSFSISSGFKSDAGLSEAVFYDDDDYNGGAASSSGYAGVSASSAFIGISASSFANNDASDETFAETKQQEEQKQQQQQQQLPVDNPQFRQTVARLEDYAVGLRPVLQSYFASTEDYLKATAVATSSRKSLVESIGSLKKYVISNGDNNHDPELNEALNLMIEKLQRENEYYEAYLRTMTTHLLKSVTTSITIDGEPLSEQFEDDIFAKRYGGMRKKFSEKSKDYYNWLGKNLSNEKSLISKISKIGSNSNNNNNIEELSIYDSDSESVMVTNSKRLSFVGKRNSMGAKPLDFMITSAGNGNINSTNDGNDKHLRRRKSFELLRLDYYQYLSEFRHGAFAEGLKIGMLRSVDATTRLFKGLDVKVNGLGAKAAEIERQCGQLTHDHTGLAKQRSMIANAATSTGLEAAFSKNQTDSVYEGVLYTSTGTKTGSRQQWKRQWVQLMYPGVLHEQDLEGYEPAEDLSMSGGRTGLDIRFGCIKPQASTTERRHTFEVITTKNEHRIFQAVDATQHANWVEHLNRCLNLSVDSQHLEQLRNQPLPARILEATKIENFPTKENININNNNTMFRKPRQDAMPGLQFDDASSFLDIVRHAHVSNATCCDCGSDRNVDWISISLLVVVCIDCSGVHRSLGSHLSKIRSLTLDVSIFTPEIVRLLESVSNASSNAYWERHVGDKQALITANAAAAERSQFIIAKYKEKRFVEADPRANSHLIYGIHRNDVHMILKSLACGGNPNMVVIKGKEKEVESSLLEYALTHYSGPADSPTFEIAELLLLNGANCGTKVVDNLNLIPPARQFWQAKIDRSMGVSVGSGAAEDAGPITNGVAVVEKKKKIHSYSSSDLEKKKSSQIPKFSFRKRKG